MILRDVYNNAINYLCPSVSLYNAKNNYFDILASTQKHGGYSLWIKFFIQQILESARRSIEQIQAYQKTIQRDEANIKMNSSSTDNTLAIYDYYKKYLVSGVKRPAEHFDIAYGTAMNAVQILKGLNILKQVSVGSRNRLFAYHELTNILTSET